MRRQQGFTLVEIMVAMVIMLVVTAATYKLLTTTQKVSRAQAERSALQSNVRSGSLVVPNELRELNTVVGGTADQNDIVALGANDITYRAMRGLGIVCANPAANQIRVYDFGNLWTSFSGYRDPAPNTDGVYVFSEGADDLHGSDDTWQRYTITAVAKAACPQAGNPPGITLTLGAALAPVPPVGTPVRTFEQMQLQLYVKDGESWLGARSVNTPGANMEPVLGPLAGANGFQLAYFDASNTATAVKENVKSVTVTMRGLSDQKVSTGAYGGSMAYATDSLATRVLLRNSIRP